MRQVVGPSNVLVDQDMVAGHVRDWTGRWVGETLAVVRPSEVAEVQEIVRVCRTNGLALVPQGGNTGLVGGSIPHRGEIVLSLLRLDSMGDVDVAAREVTVGAGVTLGALQAHARRAGLRYGVDLASRDSATVGGTIATNAGGMSVVAHGDTRRQVLGLEVVFADGSVGSSLDGMIKESTGPDPYQLMVGSEGTLGVITAARLRLLPPPDGDPMVVLVAVDRLSEGLGLLGPGVLAIEFFDRNCLEAVTEHRSLPRPLPGESPFYVLVETTHPPPLSDDAAAVVDPRLWAYRESITETVNQIGVPVKLDVSLPHSRVDEFADAVGRSGIDGRVFLYGHLAEANFHVNVVGSDDPDRVVDQVLGLVVEMGGAIASEHGIGVAKTRWWRSTTDEATLDLGRRIKGLFDPDAILNPEVLWGGDG